MIMWYHFGLAVGHIYSHGSYSFANGSVRKQHLNAPILNVASGAVPIVDQSPLGFGSLVGAIIEDIEDNLDNNSTYSTNSDESISTSDGSTIYLSDEDLFLDDDTLDNMQEEWAAEKMYYNDWPCT